MPKFRYEGEVEVLRPPRSKMLTDLGNALKKEVALGGNPISEFNVSKDNNGIEYLEIAVGRYKMAIFDETFIWVRGTTAKGFLENENADWRIISYGKGNFELKSVNSSKSDVIELSVLLQEGRAHVAAATARDARWFKQDGVTGIAENGYMTVDALKQVLKLYGEGKIRLGLSTSGWSTREEKAEGEANYFRTIIKFEKTIEDAAAVTKDIEKIVEYTQKYVEKIQLRH